MLRDSQLGLVPLRAGIGIRLLEGRRRGRGKEKAAGVASPVIPEHLPTCHSSQPFLGLCQLILPHEVNRFDV